MATLTIRNLPDDVHQGLRARAVANGRSMEAEARTMIVKSVVSEVVSPEAKAAANKAKWDAIHAQAREIMTKANGGVMPTNVVDEVIAERRITAAKEQAEYDRLAGLAPKQ